MKKIICLLVFGVLFSSNTYAHKQVNLIGDDGFEPRWKVFVVTIKGVSVPEVPLGDCSLVICKSVTDVDGGRITVYPDNGGALLAAGRIFIDGTAHIYMTHKTSAVRIKIRDLRVTKERQYDQAWAWFVRDDLCSGDTSDGWICAPLEVIPE